MRSVLSLVIFGSLVAASGCVGMEELSGEVNAEVGKPGATTAPKLNLSHVECTEDGNVLAHFVLLFAGSDTPGTLSGTYNGGSFGPIAAVKNSGNVWHYNVILPAGDIDIFTATTTTSTAVVASLHNPSEYAGEYQCGAVVSECPVVVTAQDLVCVAHPYGNVGSECAAYGLVPTGIDTSKDDGLTGLTFTATQDAYLAIVKSGSGGCGKGSAAYRTYTNVSVGDVLATPAGQNISHVTYCACPQ